VFPAFSVVFGQLFNIFYTDTPDQIRTQAGTIAAVFIGIALYNLLFGYLGQMMWGLVGEWCLLLCEVLLVAMSTDEVSRRGSGSVL
jgi:uncharacterized membrane protein